MGEFHLTRSYHLPFTIYHSPFLVRLTKKSLCTYSEIPLAGRSSNGRTADSESAYRGSNPCLPAKHFQNVEAAAAAAAAGSSVASPPDVRKVF